MIILGSFLYAIAINSFIIPGSLAEGGVTGITIVLYYLFEFSPSIVNLSINSVLLLIGYKFLDRKTIFYTLFFILSSSIFLALTETWVVHTENVIIYCIFGGVLMGAGIGVIVRAGGTTAGSVIIAKICNTSFRWNISYTTLFVDLIVVIGSIYVIGLEKMLLTIIALFIATKVMDYVIEGSNTKKSITIISDKHEEIAKQIAFKINRGITIIKGKGYYSNQDKEVLYVIIRKQELTNLRKITEKIDDQAFIIVHDVKDVLSKNFI
nr:YitT family protein [Bacillus massiliigorillae]